MTCAELHSLLTRYVDGESTPEQRALAEEHLPRCPPCERRAAREQTARVVLHSCATRLSARAPGALHAKCSAAAHESRQPTVAAFPAQSTPLWRRAALSIAATLVLVVGG